MEVACTTRTRGFWRKYMSLCVADELISFLKRTHNLANARIHQVVSSKGFRLSREGVFVSFRVFGFSFKNKKNVAGCTFLRHPRSTMTVARYALRRCSRPIVCCPQLM